MDGASVEQSLRRCFAVTSMPLACAYLFGSHARGEATRRSDIDVAVLFPPAASPALAGPATELRGELERALAAPVDLVDLRLAPVDLVHRVLRDGRLLVERDPAARIEFEVNARNAYFDLLPHLQRYREAGKA